MTRKLAASSDNSLFTYSESESVSEFRNLCLREDGGNHVLMRAGLGVPDKPGAALPACPLGSH